MVVDGKHVGGHALQFEVTLGKHIVTVSREGARVVRGVVVWEDTKFFTEL